MKDSDMELNTMQRLALKAMIEGRNIFLTGAGGTGKSVVISEFVKNTSKSVVLCAPTGVAANHIGGITIFKLLHPPLGPIASYINPAKWNQILMAADVIIVDETSMVRFDLFKYLIRTVRYYEDLRKCRIQLIVVGDMYQLPPVINDKDDGPALKKLFGNIGRGFAFQTKEWYQCRFMPIILTEQMRQADPVFIDNLNRLRVGDDSCIDYLNQGSAPYRNNGITLCPSRNEAKEINERRLAELVGESRTYDAFIEGVFASHTMPTSDSLELKNGARVMALRNDRDGRYQNGSCGTIIEMLSDSVTIRFDNGNTANVGFCTWENYDYTVNEEGKLRQTVIGSFCQLAVQLAYAITIHKSQGQTFNQINVKPECFAEGQLYVALSRVKSLEGLYIDGEIQKHHIKTCSEVKAFYEMIRNSCYWEGDEEGAEKEIA